MKKPYTDGFIRYVTAFTWLMILVAIVTMVSLGHREFPEIARWIWIVEAVVYAHLVVILASAFIIRPFDYVSTGTILAIGWIQYFAFRLLIPMVWPPYILLLLLGVLLWSLHKIGVFVLVDEEEYERLLESYQKDRRE